jgi:DNA-binding CsgD family transcriptional regulator
VIETSAIVLEGLTGIIKKSGIRCRLFTSESIEQAEMHFARNKCDVIVVNPSFFYRNAKNFNLVKSRFDSVKWIALVYSWHEPDILALFDGQINISDSEDSIISVICKLDSEEESNNQNQLQEILTERETDVLKLLAKGFANKEIADKLNISINTVITHRKNISQKTGIKSVSGLTIYAVVQKLISIDNPAD